MATRAIPHNSVRRCRLRRGWSQDQLAARAGVSRAAVGAIETNQLVPSVAAALGVARALGCSVEELFAPPKSVGPEWAWLPQAPSGRYWHARVGSRWLCFPVEPTPLGTTPHDGLFDGASFEPRSPSDPDATLVVASCDPAVSIVAAEYARSTGFRLVAIHRPSRVALRLLGEGLIHVAGLHLATAERPAANAELVRATLTGSYRLLRAACWDEGVVLAAGEGSSSIATALKKRLRWVGREPGSAARQCYEELVPEQPAPRRLARDHWGVAEAIRCGWADAGICHRFVTADTNLRYFGVRREYFDYCFAAGDEKDPRIQALVKVVRSPGFRRMLSDLPGYDPGPAGSLEKVEA